MKTKVLIVDDDEDFATLLEYSLGKQGCDTLRAPDGLQGLKMARAEIPDVILLDILLPDLDGLAVCEILHAQPSTRGIPVFMISALGESFVKGRKRQSQFDQFFTKPVDLGVLGTNIRRAAEARHTALALGCKRERRDAGL